MKNNQLSRYGAIAKALPFTFGKVFFVIDPDDAILPTVQETYPVDTDGVTRVYTSLASAYAACTSGMNDVIVLDGNSTHVLTEMLDITKSRVHIIGLDYLLGDRRLYGQSSKISLTGAVATDIHAVRNIGVRNSFSGIKFVASNTATETTGAFGEGGEYTVFRNCSFEGAKLSTTGYADMVLNGDSTQFFDCTWGTTASPNVGDIIRPNIITTAGGVAGGAGSSKDILFRGCKFLKHAGGTTGVFVNITAAADLTRGFMEFENCSFIANKTGSVPAVAIRLGASLTASQVLLTGDTIAYNCTKVATGTGVLSGQPARVATATIGIQAT
jgi:hypothetical protein